MALFRDRAEAGQRLAEHLRQYAGRPDVLVLALPRGGVPVAYEVARALGVQLDVFIVRKLGVPGRPELAMGAIASGGIRVINEEIVRQLGITADEIADVAGQEQHELARREHEYRGNRSPLHIEGCVVILIDDGLATGASMRAAVVAIKTQSPSKLVVAVPTAPPETCAEFAALVDETVCVATPQPFYGVGLWYEHFEQTSDREVSDLLESANRMQPAD